MKTNAEQKFKEQPNKALRANHGLLSGRWEAQGGGTKSGVPPPHHR